MKHAKSYTVRHYHNERFSDFTGTLEELITNVFGYTLECGNSWKRSIPRYPKTVKSLVKALNDSAYECNRYNDAYELI